MFVYEMKWCEIDILLELNIANNAIYSQLFCIFAK